jgi:tetratricopeptide (TPR) repeat protein
MIRSRLANSCHDCCPFPLALALALGGAAVGDQLASAAGSPPPLSRGAELFQQHEFDKAVRAFLADLSENSTNVEALLYLGRIGFEENRLDAAERHFQRVTALAPRNAAGFFWLGRLYGVEARELGVPRGIGPALRARRNLEKAVTLDPGNLEARADLATFYREAPALVGGSRRAARAEVEEIARRDPYFGALARGDLALADKNYDEAEREYRQARRLQPLKGEAWFRLGVLRQRTRRYDLAFAAFKKALELDASLKAAWFQIGKTADLSGQRLDEGAAALKTYLRCKPFFVMPRLLWAYRLLGNIYRKQGSPEAAREQYLAALRLAPNDDEAAGALRQLDASAAP